MRSRFSRAKAKKQLPARLRKHNRKIDALGKQAAKRKPTLRSKAAKARAEERQRQVQEFLSLRAEALAEVLPSSPSSPSPS